MQQTPYALVWRRPDLTYEQAVERASEALATEGFGILTEIDVKATLKEKLDVDMAPYVILGACNPESAHQALAAERMIGTLLPCNVVVAAEPDGGVTIAAFRPTAAFGLVGNPEIVPLASLVEASVRRALDAL